MQTTQLYPFGPFVQVAQTFSATPAIPFANNDQEVVITLAGNITSMSAVNDAELRVGSKATLRIVSDASIRTVTPDGSTMLFPVLTTVASKTNQMKIEYGIDKVWRAIGAWVQVN